MRLALAKFNVRVFRPTRDPHTQISVRLEGNTRRVLRRTARLKDASIGEIIRAALEQLPEHPTARTR